jgi:glutamyl-tRNA synthetase
MSKLIADKLFPETLPSIAKIEAIYPQRNLPEGAKVVRVAPSPTGNMHVGTLFMAMVCKRVAAQSGGVFFLRIEDTDSKREVAGATELVVKSLNDYALQPDEGLQVDGTEKGSYGPYTQSARREIYHAYVKDLIERDLAYPCFCTSEELEEQRTIQTENKLPTGYYGEFAKCRNLTDDEILERLNAKKTFVVRLKSFGSASKRIKFTDLIKGEREMPENDLDIIIMKGDGLPTYHFAHLIDDHLMGTNLVLRADEWFPSMPLHLQLFQTMGWKTPKYAHVSPIEKLDNGARRKLSKRKDPEAGMHFYAEQGYLKEALLDYLMNIANSNFEDWRKINPSKPYTDFEFSLKKINASGALFDFTKLDSVGREVIAKISAEDLLKLLEVWAQTYKPAFAQKIASNRNYVLNILKIERENVKNVRKDFAKLSDIEEKIAFFFDDEFVRDDALLATFDKSIIKNIAADFAKIYEPHDDNATWFNKVKEVGSQYNFCADMKEYKATPEKFAGSVADTAKILRVLITGRDQSPDLHDVMQVMGIERVLKRLNNL